ncbi:MAG: 23S rRNA (guanosine(2251)-2'-O)-methyltransferase RlmB [Gammaproteobacteria bacterium]|nr:23S rRNA (guanosine(2251)-2'-O)-methyltransferase RlmB [Gammaproteobacteria bacterium]
MVISGVHAVAKALESGFGLELFISNRRISSRLKWLIALADRKKCSVTVGELPDESSENNSQGVALEIIKPRYLNEKVLNAATSTEIESFVFLVLDGITDPRNFGACLRSAASYGVNGVIIPKDKAAPLNEAAIKASSGTAFFMPIYEVVNLARCIKNLKKKNIWVFGTDSQAVNTIGQEALSGKLALVMGSEGKGIRENVKAHCDVMLRVPVKNAEFTLNVSVATGICLSEIYRQQRDSK